MARQSEEIDQLLKLTNYEAEEAVLGGILIDQDAIHDVAHFLRLDHFHRESNRWIYEACLDLAKTKTPIDIVTLQAELKKRDRLENAGGDSYIVGLINAVPTSINTEHYGHIVEGLAVRRQLVAAASAIATIAVDGDQALEDAVSQAEQLVFDVSHRRSVNKIKHIKDVASQHMQYVEDMNERGKPLGISTGFKDIDRALSGGGFEKGQLVMIPGDTGMGKSSLLLDMIINMSKGGYKTALFTLEMTDIQLLQRKIAADSRIPVAKLKNPSVLTDSEWKTYYETVGKLSELDAHIDETAFLTPMQLLSKCRRLQAAYGLDVVAVDYLALMGADEAHTNETLRIGSISRALKLIAKDLDVVLIVTAQLNGKTIAGRQEKRPQLSDLRFSSDPNHDSDVVIFIFRDEYYNKETSERPGIGEAIFGKQRDGETPIVDLYWHAELMTFRDLQRQPEWLVPEAVPDMNESEEIEQWWQKP